MSQIYRIKLSENLVVEVDACAENRVVHRIEIAPVLPPEDMGKLLVEALIRRGWNRREDGRLEKTNSKTGEERVLDPEAMTLEAKIRGTMKKKVDQVLVGSRKNINQKKLIQERDRQVEEEKRILESKIRAEAARRLEESAKERAGEVQEALRDVYAEALKKKARTLGTVTEIREETGEDGRYRLTIKVAE